MVKRSSEAIDRVGRVEAERESHDADFEAGANRQLHPAKRGRFARGVRIEAE